MEFYTSLLRAAGRFAPYRIPLPVDFCGPAALYLVNFAITEFVDGLAVSATSHGLLEFRNFLVVKQTLSDYTRLCHRLGSGLIHFPTPILYPRYSQNRGSALCPLVGLPWVGSGDGTLTESSTCKGAPKLLARLVILLLGLSIIACASQTPTSTPGPSAFPTTTTIPTPVPTQIPTPTPPQPTSTPVPTPPTPTPTPTLAPTPTPTVQDVVGQFDPSLVQIGASGLWGSGFIVHADGGVVTNAHVVGGNTRVEVWLHDGQTLYGEVVGIDEYLDLAYIKLVSRRKFQAAKLGGGAELGQDVFALGFPLASVTPSLTRGIVSKVFTYADVEWLQIDALVNPGSSGGPLLDRAGRVVGIVTSRSDWDSASGRSVEGIGFALSVTVLKDRLNFLSAGGQELLPIPTPLPAPTPSPTDLATTIWADLWVYLYDDPATPGYLAVDVYHQFDAAQYMFSVFVDGTKYCSIDQIYDDGFYVMGCAFELKTHSSVQQVSAGLYLGANLTCARNDTSDSETSIFACNWQ